MPSIGAIVPASRGSGASPILAGVPGRAGADAGEWLPPMSRVARSLAVCRRLRRGAERVLVHVARGRATPRTRRSSRRPSYAADGTLLYTFHAEENRQVIPLEQIPEHVRDAVIAIEDERFYHHNGVDVRAVLRAARTNAAAGDVEQGGSTITQQYVKQEILRDNAQTVARKVQEAALAVQLERDVLQGPHPRAVPERDLLRERRLRDRGRRPPVLRQGRPPTSPCPRRR